MRYIVNESEGVVVAIVQSVHHQLYKAIRKACPALILNLNTLVKTVRQFPNTYAGVAKCFKEEDIWNEETGIRLASARALFKYTIAETKVLFKLQDILHEYVINTEQKLENNTDMLEDLYNKTFLH
jgi:hypothetical protein